MERGEREPSLTEFFRIASALGDPSGSLFIDLIVAWRADPTDHRLYKSRPSDFSRLYRLGFPIRLLQYARPHAPCSNAPLRPSSRSCRMRYEPRDLRASDQGLGRNARFADAGPTYRSGLDRGDAPASLGLIHRQCLASFSTAEDKDIECSTALMGRFLSKIKALATP
jgi:hypothetical protein